MMGRFLCFIGLHRWMYLNKDEECRVCGRKDCHRSQIQEKVFCGCPACEGVRYSLIWINTY